MVIKFTGLLKAWLYRDVLMSLGIIDVTRQSLEYTLTQKGAGHSVVIVVGGAAEILDTRFDSYVLTLKRRKGFIKLALQTGFVWQLVAREMSEIRPEKSEALYIIIIPPRCAMGRI